MAKPLQQGISPRHHLGTCVHSVWGLLYQLSLSNGDLTSLAVQSGPGHCWFTTPYLAPQTCLSVPYCMDLGQRQKEPRAI